MARPRRFTVRLAEPELAAIQAFANEKHVLASSAVRRLISLGLAAENRTGYETSYEGCFLGNNDQIS